MIHVIILYVILFYLTGYPFFRAFFRKAGLLECLIYPQILGLVISPILLSIGYVLFYAGYAMIFVLVSSIILNILFMKYVKSSVGKKTCTTPDKYVSVFLASLFLFLLFITASRDLTNVTDDNSWIAISATNINNFRGLPPETPCLPKESVPYQWGPSIVISSLSYTAGYTPLFVMNIVAPYFLVMVFFAGYLTGNRIIKKRGSGLVVLAILFFMNIANPPYFGSQLYIMPLVIMHTLLFYNYFAERSKRSLFLAGVISSLMIYIHGLTFIFLSLLSVSFLLFLAIFKRSWLKDIFYLAAPYAFSLPYFALLGHADTKALVFQPLAVLLEFDYLHVFGPLLAFSIIYFFRRKERDLDFFISAFITIFIFSSLFLMPWSPNITRPMEGTAFYTVLFSASLFLSLDKKTGSLLMLITLLIFSYTNILTIKNNTIGHLIGTSADQQEASEVKAVAEWMKSNSEKSSIFLVSPDQSTDSAIYSALSERRAFFCHDQATFSYFINPKERMEDAILMYTNPTKKIYESNNVSFVVLCSKEKRFFAHYDLVPFNFNTSEAFREIYSKDGCRVYSADAQMLEDKEVDRRSLNYTLYSRWFQSVG